MPDDPISILVAEILKNQRSMGDKLDRVMERMATRDEIVEINKKLDDTVTREEYRDLKTHLDGIDTTIAEMKSMRFPAWFTTALATLAVLLVSGIGIAIYQTAHAVHP